MAGVVRVQNGYRVTKILLNADIPEVHEFRQRLIHSSLCTKIIVNTSQQTSCTVNDELEAGVSVITIKELCENSEGGSFWICGTVVNIDGAGDWFYISCKKCSKKIEKLEHRFYCKNCSNFSESGEMKYNIIINVADESSSSPFVLWDRECKNVIGKPAAEVKVQTTTDESEVPNEIRDALLQKKYMFKIKAGDIIKPIASQL
ncbi:uncharacterized protein LOC130984995 [Salvia miltiorrhiza]|uniref:uncharacterized protein LOC130984995 n=1 Tax=Salvia miltiorrhiza TaxID=226208 RepID=UPI0025AC52F7|nr:uncharacterized protein LOC130984995 [Salvia miltiorrhiza]